MKAIPKTTVERVDPWPYDGPIERADGVRPYNRYLWPTESWWPNRQARFYGVSGRHHFGIISLKDGRYSTEGAVYYIEQNKGSNELPCVFATRLEAIRIAAARAIKLARASSNWSDHYQSLKGHRLADVINWYRDVVARESGKPEPLPIKVSDPIPPTVRPEAGLPLFDRVPNASLTLDRDERS